MYVGELALLTDRPRNATVIAKTDMVREIWKSNQLLERLVTKSAWRTAPLASRAIGVALVGGLLLLFADESPEAAPSHHHLMANVNSAAMVKKIAPPKRTNSMDLTTASPNAPTNRERSSAGCHARDGGQYDRYIKDQRSPPQILQ